MDTKDLQNSDAVQDEQNNLEQSQSETNVSQTEGDNQDHKEEPTSDTKSEEPIEEATQKVNDVKSEEKEETSPEKETEGKDTAEDKQETSPEKETEGKDTAEDKQETGKTEDSEVKEDYSSLSKEQLVKELYRLIEDDDLEKVRFSIDQIKTVFYKKHKAFIEKEQKEFVDGGGDPDKFEIPNDDTEIQLKAGLKFYKEKKIEHGREIEKEKELNLESKYQVIEELKDLINKKESIGETFKEFRELQNKWKEIGSIPQPKIKDLWSTYHHHVEKFYDYIKINKELRDLDLKKNLEAKEELCNKTDVLLDESSIVNAFKILQKYHNQWREIGPVPPEMKDTLWERFSETTKKINKKHQEYFKELKEKQKDNLVHKTQLCEKVEGIANAELSSHKDWNQNTQLIFDLQKEWRTIGFAPKKDNNKIYARFRASCDTFFERKREFYAQNKEWQDKNLELKMEICEKAEQLQESDDWKKTTKDLLALQKDWKDIGPVPRKHSDKIWKRFRAACDHFFNKKSEYYQHIEEEYEVNLKLKEELIEKVKQYNFVDSPEENYAALKKFQEEWSEIGFVPYNKKDTIQNLFRDAINEQFDKLKIDDKEKKILKFQTRLDNLQHKPKASSKIKHERDKFFNKIKKLETNIKVWENNLGFISSESDEATLMIKDYNDKIDQAKEEIRVMEEKIRMIDRMDNE